jgi:xanthine dehydrogenase YagS FAD-binding subunit
VKPFTYTRPMDANGAIASAAADGAAYLAGGTTLVDLARLGVMQPARLVDIGRLPLAGIESVGDGLRIGALATNAAVASDPDVLRRFPALAQALLAGASPQIRNMATVGGNLLQRTRCPYFRDPATRCNKRTPGSGCDAIGGYARSHAVLGTSAQCIATHASDMAVALVALDATVRVRTATGERTLAITDLHTDPGDHPEIETRLVPGELIIAVELPARPFAARSTYVKVRDRAAFAFALASAAVALHLEGGEIREARIALGGVATRPWRSTEAEAVLAGQRPTPDVFRAAADAALSAAKPQPDNAFKIELARRTIRRALALAAAGGGT